MNESAAAQVTRDSLGEEAFQNKVESNTFSVEKRALDAACEQRVPLARIIITSLAAAAAAAADGCSAGGGGGGGGSSAPQRQQQQVVECLAWLPQQL